MTNITVQVGEAQFTLRAAALFLHEGHVLLHTCDADNLWALPGGRVQAMESSTEGGLSGGGIRRSIEGNQR